MVCRNRVPDLHILSNGFTEPERFKQLSNRFMLTNELDSKFQNVQSERIILQVPLIFDLLYLCLLQFPHDYSQTLQTYDYMY